VRSAFFRTELVLVLVLVLHNCEVTVSSTGARNQFPADDNGHVGRPGEVSLSHFFLGDRAPDFEFDWCQKEP